jgi:sterol desaturase/sphingolipid hydroxylase (fatty acid hydroxylase superfamily)
MASMLDGSIAFVGAAIAAFTLGTFAEYFVHRAMHWGLLYPEGHLWHHESNDPRTFLRDVFDYGTGAAAFWMKRPVHRLHHEGGEVEGNYGILVDWWDRLFGSYVPIERQRSLPARGEWLKAYLAIPWR